MRSSVLDTEVRSARFAEPLKGVVHSSCGEWLVHPCCCNGFPCLIGEFSDVLGRVEVDVEFGGVQFCDELLQEFVVFVGLLVVVRGVRCRVEAPVSLGALLVSPTALVQRMRDQGRASGADDGDASADEDPRDIGHGCRPYREVAA